MGRQVSPWNAVGATSAVVVLVCCLSAQQRDAAPGALLGQHMVGGSASQQFVARNAVLNARQRQIDEARMQVLRQVLGVEANTKTKGTKQSLYMETDAAPSTGMLQEYWKDFTALPPSRRPGLGLAESPDDIDARISLLHRRSAKLGQVAQSSTARADDQADEVQDEAMKRSSGARRMKLDELDEEANRSLMASVDDGSVMAASLGKMANRNSRMASDGTMAGGGGNMADGGVAADSGHLFDASHMASQRGLQASQGSMAGEGLLSGTNRILAGDGILANDRLMSSRGRGMTYKSASAPRLSILAQQQRTATARHAHPAGRSQSGNSLSTEVYVNRFVPVWRPWEHCATDKGPESRAVCHVMREMGENGSDGMGDSPRYSFRPASRQSLQEVEDSRGVASQQRVASRELMSRLEPLNVMQAQLNLERLRLVRGLLLPALDVEEGSPGSPVMMVEDKGRLVRAVLYTDISDGSDGGFNAPYDLNGDGQYVDNWAKVSTDWSYTQPTAGYLSPMPSSNPGPDDMGGRPYVTWKSADPRRLTQLTGSVPEWTQSPWLSVFSDASARKIRDSPVMKALGGIDLTDTSTPAHADTPTSDIIPDYQRVAAKNGPAHTRFQYSAPVQNGHGCHTLSNEGCEQEAVQGASDTGRPLYIEYHPLRLVPEDKFARGKNVEEAGDQAADERAEQDHAWNDQEYPTDLEEFDEMRAAAEAAAKETRPEIFHDELVPQGRSAWSHTDSAGKHDKDLEEGAHLNVVAQARPQQLEATELAFDAREPTYDYSESLSPSREAHLSEADTRWQDYLFDQRMKGRYIMSSSRAERSGMDQRSMLRQEQEAPGNPAVEQVTYTAGTSATPRGVYVAAPENDFMDAAELGSGTGPRVRRSSPWMARRMVRRGKARRLEDKAEEDEEEAPVLETQARHDEEYEGEVY